MHYAKALAYLLRSVLDAKEEYLSDLSVVVLSRAIRRLRVATGRRCTGVPAPRQAEVVARKVNV